MQIKTVTKHYISVYDLAKEISGRTNYSFQEVYNELEEERLIPEYEELYFYDPEFETSLDSDEPSWIYEKINFILDEADLKSIYFTAI